jgi:asparagine synthase (glutamine-hydrolysing)
MVKGHWQNESGHVLLGHRRLSIIDLSEAGHQPLIPNPSPRSGEGGTHRYTIIHNGEIYNYIELREELLKKGYSFHSQTDTEVIAAAMIAGEMNAWIILTACLLFAIWDEKEKELFAARDRFGEKPFFYFLDGQKFLFASEMKALWPPVLNAGPTRKCFLILSRSVIPITPANFHETFFENISKLPGGLPY